MVTRLLLLVLCLGVLSTVPGCYVEPASYGTSSSGGGTDDKTRQYRKPWGDATDHPWNRFNGYMAPSG